MKSRVWWKTVFCSVLLALGFAGVAHAADAPSANMTRQQKDAVCTRCHDESDESEAYILSIYQTPHGAMGDSRTPACQDCHGASQKHLAGNLDGKGRPQPDVIFGSKRTIAGYEPASAQDQSEACLSCHKSGLRQHWPGSQHQSNDVACTSCHVVHNPVDPVRVKATQPEVCFQCHQDQRALFKRISAHPVEAGKMTCSDCHNPHGSGGDHMLKQNTVNETCFLCHADKRGPFLWEHQPSTEDCTTCHNPHGSNITPLLTSRPPFLCAECHDGPHNSQQPYGSMVAGTDGTTAPAAPSPSQMAMGRACMNCHVMVHGSNSPSGAFLHR